MVSLDMKARIHLGGTMFELSRCRYLKKFIRYDNTSLNYDRDK